MTFREYLTARVDLCAPSFWIDFKPRDIRISNVVVMIVLGMLLGTASQKGLAQSPSGLTTIDFENLSGPSLFSVADPPLTIDSATFTGGQVLTDATYLPADPTSVYGTSYFCTGCADTITIDFAQKVSNFSMLLLNGLYYTVTYTVEDDQGGTQQITIVANGDSGAATVSLAESGIRQVVIAADPTTFDFEIDDVQFSATNVSLIDPVASGFLTQYANSGSISTDTDLLSSGGNLVQGASADGVTQVLVRIPTAQAGTTFNLSLQDENGNASSTGEIGGLFKLGGAPKDAASGIAVTSVNTVNGPMAYAIYLAPTDFTRQTSDDSLAVRPVMLQVAGGGQFTGMINIVRPPVVLIHGIWDSAAGWATFQPSLTAANTLHIYPADYSGLLSGVSATSPTYEDVPLNTLRSNAVGFDYNAPTVEKQIRAFIQDFKMTNDVAAVQADLVGHSMGGDISRDLVTVSGFARGDTYGLGLVDKLITIGTPHLGTPLATALLNGSNNCVESVLEAVGNFSFSSLTINGVTVSGAVGDLMGNGDGTNLSPVLAKLHTTALPFPIAYITATSNSTNWVNLGQSLLGWSWWIRNAGCRSSAVAQALTPSGWPSLFGGATSDSIVPEQSQINNLSVGAGGPFTGLIHTSSLESLNFSGPAELDSASSIAGEVITLLNEAKSGSDYHPYGGAQ